jgi:transposase
VDESGMNDNDYYPYAYKPIGVRHYEPHPGHYKKRISMIGGLCNHTFLAPFMFEGYCNAQLFETYLEHVLLPNLKEGLVVIIDNAAFHKTDKIKNLIESVGAQLIYLPPYSPELNPIEHYWFKIKNAIRKLMRDSKFNLNDAMQLVLKNLSTC